MKNLRLFISLLLWCLAASLLFYPFIGRLAEERKQEAAIESFLETKRKIAESKDKEGGQGSQEEMEGGQEAIDHADEGTYGKTGEGKQPTGTAEGKEKEDTSRLSEGETSSHTSEFPEEEEAESSDEDGVRLRSLQREVARYNERIVKEKQNGLKDAWSYEEAEFSLEEYGVEGGAFGILRIPAMGITLPLYLGATEENMAKGAVVLGHTSIPVGAGSSNSVIAAHRGWYTHPMFTDIEKLHTGDSVQIENLWDILDYEVEDVAVIYPDDMDVCSIREGKDMVTLITCHPLGQNTHRYVVSCRRTGKREKIRSQGTEDRPEGKAEKGKIKKMEQERREKTWVPGEDEAVRKAKIEKILRPAGAFFLLVWLLIILRRRFL